MNNKNYSATYRIIHWAIGVAMILLLITIFLRLTWMNKFHVAGIIDHYLQSNGQSLSQDELIVLAKQIRQPMWDWHIYLGYALTGLFALRFLLPFFNEMKFRNPLGKNLTLKVRFQYWTYIIFYLCIVISLVTGLIIELGPKSLKKSMEDIHILSVYYLVPFLVIHIAGVLLAEFTDRKGILSRIVSGKNRNQ